MILQQPAGGVLRGSGLGGKRWKVHRRAWEKAAWGGLGTTGTDELKKDWTSIVLFKCSSSILVLIDSHLRTSFPTVSDDGPFPLGSSNTALKLCYSDMAGVIHRSVTPIRPAT